MVVVTVRFHKIDDIDAVLDILACILNSEKVPLGITIGAIVIL